MASFLNDKSNNTNTNGILSTDPVTGLSSIEARHRLSLYGPNGTPIFLFIHALALPSEPPKSLLESLLDQFRDHLVQILLLSAFVSFLLASSDYYYSSTDALSAHSMSVFVEPFVILVILAGNAAVGVIQESQAEHAINVHQHSFTLHPCLGLEGICTG